MTVLVWLHLVGASLWLGGLVTLAVAVLVAARTVARDAFGRFVRAAGWTFAGLSGLAWALLAVSGLVLAARLGWPALAVAKGALGGGLLAAAALHVLTGRSARRPLVLVSRVLAVLLLIGTLVAFWLGVQLAS
jgi:uncharacterized membrane protein